jgi:predicted ATPase
LPEVYRVAAKVALGESPETPNTAEGQLRHAIQLARNQGAKLWEIRATTSLARLLRDTNRRDEARAMLAEIYNWFTEGFDTADLKRSEGSARGVEQMTAVGRSSAVYRQRDNLRHQRIDLHRARSEQRGTKKLMNCRLWTPPHKQSWFAGAN